MEIQHTKLQDAAKAVLGEKFIRIRNKKDLKQPNFTHQGNQKKQKLSQSQQKEDTKDQRKKRSNREQKNSTKETAKLRVGFLKKINKIDKPLAGLTKKKEDK